MIYTFDKKQNILRVLDENNFLTAELTFKINEAATLSFTVTPEYELTDKEKYVALPHPLDQTKFIMLRLISRTDNKDDIEYTAYEYAYQELSTSGYIKDTRPQNANALTLMTKALDGSGWSVGRITVAGTATTNFYYTDYLSAVSKVVELLGGEIVFYIEITGNKITGRYMDYLFCQGVDTSKVFADGSNLLSVARKKQSDSIYTAILPRGKGEQVSDGVGNDPDGYGRRIDIKDVVWSKANGKPLNKPVGSFILEDPQATAEYGQANGNARLLIKNFDEVDDPNVLIQQAYNMLMTMNHPLIEYSATVADVGGLSLGDTVLIMHGQRNLSYKTRVFQVKYDLLHIENTELSLGDNLSSNNITSQINAIRSSIQTNSNQQAWTVSQFGRPSTTFGATQPTDPKIGDTWFKSLPDGNVEIWHYNGTIWVKVVTPTTGEEIAKAVDDAVSQAKEHVEEVKTGLVNDIATAKSQAVEAANTAQQNAIDVASKSLGTYLVRLLPGTNIFKTTNSTTIQAQVWKAGQDITSTLDSASFSWKIAKDGANAISLTNNVKNVTAKPSDFNNTGTYIVNVIIPVTDTTGATRNQTFSDSTTIAKVTDGQDGSDGNGISSTTITYATSASGTNAPTSGYTSTIPTVNKGQFLWQRTATSYTNGTTKNSDVVTYFAKDGLSGANGMDGGQGMISQPTKPTSGLVDGFLWLDTSQTYPVYYIYDSSIKDFKIYQFNAKNINADQIKAKFVGTDRLSASEITVSSTNGTQTSLANFNLGEMSQTIYDNGQNLTQVKNTADGISNFVRDANGNISYDFQTAFSKTSLITGSTLASSIQTQTASQISSALTDNNGNIISLINQDSSGVQISGKNIVLDGNTTVTGDFYAKGGHFTNLNASNMLIGTLNGDLINITNIKASNIVSGSISGTNLDINLNTGSVVFQKGRINSSDYTTDINIDAGYISTADGDTRALLTQGKLQLIDPTLFSPQKSPYLEISNYSGLFNGMSALIKARDSLTVSINGYDDRSYDTPALTEKFVGLNVRKRNDILSPTKIGGAEQGVIISGGHQFNMLDNGFSPYIYVGSDSTGSYPNGDRVYISASYFHSLSTFARTTSSSANVVVSGDGALIRSSSSSKYKLDIEYEQQADTANRLLTLDPATWYDKFESEQLNKFHEIGVDPERTIDMSNHRYYGIIAEDLVKAGLEHIVSRNVETGEVEGVEYSKIGVALIPIIRDLRNRLNDQNVEIERLKEKIK